MSSRYRVLCGVPKEYCSGSKLSTDQAFPTDKCHSSHTEAYRCMARYLVKVLKYTALRNHSFAPPDGGPVRILTKRSRYGGLLIFGKEHTRFMPEKRRQGNRGVIF